MVDKFLADPVLVGREGELEGLTRCLDSALAGEGNTVFVSGEAGSGKTRLAAELLTVAKRKGVVVLSGWCLSNAAAPYFPFVEAFKSFFASAESEGIQDAGTEISAWLTGLKQSEKNENFRNLAPQAWKDLTFEVVSKTLKSILTENPIIFFIEDSHWADSASLALFHYISRTLRSERFLVLATFRSEEITTDVEGYGHPLAEELRLMRRENLFKEVKLDKLGKASVIEITENMMGGKVNPELSETLSKESGGNPLFVVESLRMLFERGSLYIDNGQWRLTVDTLGIPDRFKDVIMRRLSRLKFNQRRVLDAASIIGEKFDTDLISAVLNQDSIEVLENLNTIARSTSLIHIEANHFRFDHAMSRLAIYEEISPPLKKGYHKRVAEKLEATHIDGKLPLSEIAYHYAEAGTQDKAIKFAFDAGKEAYERFSNAEAIKQFKYILDTLPESAENAEKRAVAAEALGDAYYANCMFKDALSTFEQLAASEAGATKLRAYRKAMDTIFFGDGDKSHFDELVKKAEPYAALDRVEAARIRFFKASYLPRAESEVEWEAALQVFEEEYSIPDVARTLSALGVDKNLLHPDEEGLTATIRSAKMSEELSDLREMRFDLQWTGLALYSRGFHEEAIETLSKAVEIGTRIGAYNQVAMSQVYLSQAQEQLGLFEDAIATAERALKNCEQSGGVGPVRLLYACLVRYYARVGNVESAEANYLKLEKLPQKAQPADNYMTGNLYFARAQAALFVLKNQWEEAKQSYDRAFELGRKISVYVEMFVRNDYAWALAKQGRMEEVNLQLREAERQHSAIKERFSHVNVQANLIAPWKITAGKEFEMRLDLVNVSRQLGTLVKTEFLVPPKFRVTSLPDGLSIENGCLDLERRKLNPFQVEPIKLTLKAFKPGTYELSPQVTYVDESGESKISKSPLITITVQPVKHEYEVLPGRVSTGFEDLDALLFGGVPEKYAVTLASPSCNEREQLVKRFLEAGTESNEVTFFVTVEPASALVLADEHPTAFFLVVCNPQADAVVQSKPNIFKLKGVESLTEIEIALTRAFRSLNPGTIGPRRICMDILSDILLQHHAVNTRRWLSALLPTLKSKGFTILAVMDPGMHPPEEFQAILGLFDGEIRITEKETAQGSAKALRIRKLLNQKYQENEVILSREKFEQYL